jgi:hypothetical protein
MQSTIQTETYNGWCNYETWLGNLWLTNDEWSYKTLMEAYHQGEDSFDHSEWLEGVLRNQLEEEGHKPSLWTDLLQSAFSRINCIEIIENNQQ